MFHDFKSPVCFACHLSSSQHLGNAKVKPEAGSVSHAGLLEGGGGGSFFFFLFCTLPFIQCLPDASTYYCQFLQLSYRVVMLIPILEKVLENFK